MTVSRLAGLVLGAAILAPACSGDGNASAGEGENEPRELIISAAASLTDAFTDIGTAFEEENDGVSVIFNFGPSDGLATQINDGAPVDVFASASTTWMDSVEADGPGLSGRADFARNKLAVIVPADNPAGIESLEDLTEDGTQIVLAAESVPAGDYAREIFDNAGIADAAMDNVVSNEEDVRAVLTKVLSGDADAGVTYVTDVTPDIADQVRLITIPDDLNVIATYPIAVVAELGEAELAQAFVDYVVGPGQETLADYGFLPAS